jgi:predicted nuclease of predicted toxin-antitoxin system
MKLLFDHNLSPRIPAVLSPEFPGSKHLYELGLDRAADLEVWEFAKANDYCIVSKDSDFSDWGQVFGFPPAIIWVRTGNCSTKELITKLRRKTDVIRSLGKDGQSWILVLL